MAVFFTNICNFKNCGIIFPTLNNLIEHIEEFHIDFNTNIYEENLSPYEFMPLSKILKYSSCKRVKNTPAYDQKTKVSYKQKPPIRVSENYDLTKPVEDVDVVNTSDANPSTTIFNSCSSSYSNSCTSSSNSSLSNSPIDSYIDNNFQKTNNYSMVDPANFKTNSKMKTVKKLYSCTIPGCSKSYKHSNGIRYHTKFGHCSFDTKSKTRRKENRFTECTTFNDDLKHNNFTSMCKPAGEFSFEMDARNRNISEHGYSTPYCNGPIMSPYILKNKVPYYV